MEQFEQSASSEPEINLKEYLYLLWSWGWLIGLAGLLAGMVTYVISINTIPIYETSTRLLVSEPPAMRNIEYTGIVTGQTTTRTYAEMLVDRPVLQGVIDQLQLAIAPDDLKETISVQVVRDTQLLVITVQHTDPNLAAAITNAIASVFTDRIQVLQSQRYSATQESLAQQILDMELQIEETDQAIARETDASQLLQLQARLTEYRSLYSQLVTNFEEVRLAEAQNTTNVVVSEPAAVPSIPVSPKTTRNTLLATIAGMLLAGGTVFALDTLDDTIKNPDEIRKRFNLLILGMIASHEAQGEVPISLSKPRSPVAEAFRSLRTNITYAAVDTPLRRIIITSATPQEGKTTVSTNLAVVLAQGEKKVVLIDADLRRPQVHHKFELPNIVGLSELFLMMRPLVTLPRGVIQSTNAPGLDVVTSGKLPPNPAELLTSNKMSQFLDLLDHEYDLVVIDTPPVLTVTDAAALASKVDGVILVAKPGVTKLSAFKETIGQLRGVGARVLGVVLNEVNPTSRKYGYYYSRYYSEYSHYYEPNTKKRKSIKRTTPISR
jgi:capsular exopolysaccharide synthesis family protein